MALTQKQIDSYNSGNMFDMSDVQELQKLGATQRQIYDIANKARLVDDQVIALYPGVYALNVTKSWGDVTKVPAEFDWIKYLNANPELQDLGINTSIEAKWHYARTGNKESKPSAPSKTAESSYTPPPLVEGRIEEYQKLRQELVNQYNSLVKLAPSAVYRGDFEDIDRTVFSQQAQALFNAGVRSLSDLTIKDGKLIMKATGLPVTTSNLGGQVVTDERTGVLKWGDTKTGVKGAANWGVQTLPDGSLLFFPAYKKTASPLAQVGLDFLEPLAALGGTVFGTIIGGPAGAGIGNSIGQLLATGDLDLEKALAAAAISYAGSEISSATAGSAKDIGASVAPAASKATQVAIGEAAINAGVGAGIYGIAGGDPLTGAILGAAGSVTSTTYAQSVGKSIAPTATAATQITIGNSILNAGLSGVVAAATNADVAKSMLVGAAKGAVIANTKEIAEAIVGKENIAAVVNATNLTKAQVENIIATSVANGVMAEVANTGKFAETMFNTLVSGGVSTSVANGVVNNIKLDVAQEKGIFSATRNLASAATSAVLQGKDVGLALEMAAPGAILSGYQAYGEQLDRDEQAAQREKELAALQQPLLVAGPVPSVSSPLESALQQAIDRGERIVSQDSYIDPESGQRVVTYKVQGYSRGDINSLNPNEIYDPSLFYEYTVSYDPELGVDYQWGGQQDGDVVSVASKLPPTFNESAGGLVKAEESTQVAPTEQADERGAGLSEELRQSTLDLLIQNELTRLENELSSATQTQKAFEGARGQFERLSDLPVGTIDQQLQRQLEDELANLERQATEGQGRIPQIERERGDIEGIGTEGGRTLSDEQLLGYLETGEVPQGLLGGQPEGEGTAPEGGFTDGADGADGADGGAGGAGGAGGGGGGGGDGGAGGGDGGGALEPTAITTPLSPALIFSQSLPARPETTPFASRVTGEALEGILGEKQPLFGGDDDEQRAVWNRRSLRLLSRALGI